MFRNWLMMAASMVAALALWTLTPAHRAAWGAAESAEQGAGTNEDVDLGEWDWMLDLFPSGLEGLHKVEASLYPGPLSGEWETVLGVSPTEVSKEFRSRIDSIPGLDGDGDWMSGDPWLALDIEPLVERSDDGKPVRVFVSVVLRLEEWVYVPRPPQGEERKFIRVMGTSWDGRRLVSGPPVEVLKKVQVAAVELLDSFERAYRSANEKASGGSSEPTGGD
jgi:hypothetical protein